MKGSKKKLHLKRERVKDLSKGELANVGGGGKVHATDNCGGGGGSAGPATSDCTDGCTTTSGNTVQRCQISAY